MKRIIPRVCTLIRSISWRVVYFFCGAASFVISYYYGATLHLGIDEANSIIREITAKNNGIDQSAIFFNNVKPALGMFIPAFGPGLGYYSGYSTGLVFSAFKDFSPALKTVSPLGPLLKPFGIMEVFVYSTAISRSGMLTYQLIKRKGLRQSAIYTGIEIGIVVVILLIASIIEWQEIERRLQQRL